MNKHIKKNKCKFINKGIEDKGITLIALVITIIVLLILAGVSINALVDDGGILGKAERAVNAQKMAEEKERLELIKTIVAIDNNGEVTLEQYIDKLIKEGITSEDEVTDNEDGSKQVITDKGYSVNVKPDGEDNVIITVEGKVDSLPVRIVNIQLTTNTNNIKVDVEVLRGEAAIYKYYYKTEDTEYKLAYEGNENSYTIESLQQNTTYTIKVEAINQNGTVYKEVVGRTEEVQSAVGILEFGSLEWNNGQAKVTITKNTTDDLKIQYQILDEKLETVKDYQEIESGEKITEINLGETVEARLWDGTNGGSTASITVLDEVVPNSATITLSATETTTVGSITATVTQSDSQSGVNIANCRWVLNTNSSTTISESLYTGTFTTETDANITLSQATAGTYYLHVLTVDKAGNTTQTRSSAIKIEKATIKNLYSEIQTNTVTTQDSKGNKVMIPGGFKIASDSGTTVQQGIVIEDSSGNQFVWVPVSNINHDGSNKIILDDGTSVEITLGRYTFDTTTGEVSTTEGEYQYASNYANTVELNDYYYELKTFRESTSSLYGTNATAKDLAGFVSSVSTNKGYYLARYEASYASGSTAGVGNNSTYYKPKSKVSTGYASDYMVFSSGILWRNTTQGQASKICRQMYYGDTYVESDLCNSYAWDTAIVYIQAMGNSNYANADRGSNTTVKNTGTTGDEKCKIFDMAGNMMEWTTEYSSLERSDDTGYLYPCTYRGGSYARSSYTSSRQYKYATDTLGDLGFRPVLYLK